jgi:DNA replication and repair protein RecF
MHLDSLSLINFRNYKKAKLKFGQVNILFGKNTAGKTNLLEAIHFLSYTYPFKFNHQRNLINKNAAFTRLEGLVFKDRKLNIIATLESKSNLIYEKKFKVNKILQKPSNFLGDLKVISFLPSDISLINAPPSQKRRHFNKLLILLDPLYCQKLLRLKKIIHTRNKLLELIRNKKSQKDELLFWDKELANYGAFVFLRRQQVISLINKIIKPIYQDLTSTKDKLSITYQSFFQKLKKFGKEKIVSGYQAEIAKIRHKETRAACSLLGPHRDDFIFKLNNYPLIFFGSRSQFREAILALKLSEGKLVEKVTLEKPILLLDDVGSELDEERKNYLFDFLKKYILPSGQVFITTTSLEKINKEFLEKAKIFKIENGKVCL